MADMTPEGTQKPTAEFWISLALLTIGTIITLILLHNGGRDQVNIEKKSTFLQTSEQRMSGLTPCATQLYHII